MLDERVDEELGDWAGRCRDFSADRGLDRGPLKAKRWQLRPPIEPREIMFQILTNSAHAS